MPTLKQETEKALIDTFVTTYLDTFNNPEHPVWNRIQVLEEQEKLNQKVHYILGNLPCDSKAIYDYIDETLNGEQTKKLNHLFRKSFDKHISTTTTMVSFVSMDNSDFHLSDRLSIDRRPSSLSIDRRPSS